MQTTFNNKGKEAPFFSKVKNINGNVLIEIPFNDLKTAENFIQTFCKY